MSENITSSNYSNYQDLSYELPGIRHPRIDIFDKLFEQHPECQITTPQIYIRQPVARQVIRKGYRWHNVGYFASRLNTALVPFESSLEKQACAYFESWRQISHYVSQPYPIALYYGNSIHTVYPDFEITTINNIKILVDVKPAAYTQKRNFLKRSEALDFYTHQIGKKYSILTENEIRGQRLENACWLMSLARGKAQPELIVSVWEWLSTKIGQKISHIFDITSEYPQVRSVIATLTLDGYLTISWDTPIQEQVVSLISGSEE